MSSSNWSEMRELGGGMWQFRLSLAIYQVFGPRFLRLIAGPISFFFYLFSPARRRFSKDYLRTVSAFTPGPERTLSAVRHFRAFAVSMVDKMAAWSGRLNREELEVGTGDYSSLVKTLQKGRGVLALCSHLGNIEMLRALGSFGVEEVPNLHIVAIVEFRGTSKFNRVIESIEESSMTDLVHVSDIGPETILTLKEKAENGAMIVIAGDRTAPDNIRRHIRLPFLGRPAAFPYGAYLLADLLELPVYNVFAVRVDDVSLNARYRYHVWNVTEKSGGPRKQRDERITRIASSFRDHLQELVMAHPYQWFNFYPYWELPREAGKDE